MIKKNISNILGVLAVGLFAEDPYPLETTNNRTGLFKGKLSTSVEYFEF